MGNKKIDEGILMKYHDLRDFIAQLEKIGGTPAGDCSGFSSS